MTEEILSIIEPVNDARTRRNINTQYCVSQLELQQILKVYQNKTGPHILYSSIVYQIYKCRKFCAWKIWQECSHMSKNGPEVFVLCRRPNSCFYYAQLRSLTRTKPFHWIQNLTMNRFDRKYPWSGFDIYGSVHFTSQYWYST